MAAPMSKTSQMEMWMPPTPGKTPTAPKLMSMLGNPVAKSGRAKCGRREPRGAVGADGEEGHIAEIEQACVADHHVQAERHHHVDGHRHHRVHARRVGDDRHAARPEPVLREHDRISDCYREHGHRHDELTEPRRQDVEREDDREHRYERQARLGSSPPHDEEHEPGGRRERQAFDPARLPLPAPLRIVNARGR